MGSISLKECNGAILNSLKRISDLGPPISPSGHQGAPILSSLGSLISHCFIKGPQINVPLRHQGPNFPFSSSGHLAPPSFPIALLRVSNFPIASSKGKGPYIFHCVIKGPQFPHHVIKLMTSNFPSHYQGVPIHHCVIKGPHWYLWFPITLSKGPIYHYVINGPPFPPSRHQREPHFRNLHHEICTD